MSMPPEEPSPSLALLKVVFSPYLCRSEWLQWVQGSGDSGPQRHFNLLGKWAYSFSNANAFTSLNEVPACFQDQGFYQGLEISGFNSTVQTRYTQTHGFHER